MNRGKPSPAKMQELDGAEASEPGRNFKQRLQAYLLRTLGEDMPNGRALELGCFQGDFTRLLGEVYGDLTVVEGASELIGLARQRAPRHVEFVLSRIEDFEPEYGFDAIFLNHTLEQAEDPVALLNCVRGWLTERGRLFVVAGNGNAASRQIAAEIGGTLEPRGAARRAYNLSTLKGQITEAGLFATKSGGVFFKPFAADQFEALMAGGVVGEDYLEGCYQLGKRYPDLCADIYAICEPWSGKPYSRRGSR